MVWHFFRSVKNAWNLPIVISPRRRDVHSFGSRLRMMTRPCRRLVVGRTVLTGHDTGRRRRRRGLVVRVAGELIGGGCGGGGARSWHWVAGCSRGAWVVITSCGIVGAERSRCCIASHSCRRGALLSPGARVTCRRKDAYILDGQQNTSMLWQLMVHLSTRTQIGIRLYLNHCEFCLWVLTSS